VFLFFFFRFSVAAPIQRPSPTGGRRAGLNLSPKRPPPDHDCRNCRHTLSPPQWRPSRQTHYREEAPTFDAPPQMAATALARPPGSALAEASILGAEACPPRSHPFGPHFRTARDARPPICMRQAMSMAAQGPIDIWLATSTSGPASLAPPMHRDYQAAIGKLQVSRTQVRRRMARLQQLTAKGSGSRARNRAVSGDSSRVGGLARPRCLEEKEKKMRGTTDMKQWRCALVSTPPPDFLPPPTPR